MFYEDEYEDDETAPEEESFPVEEGDNYQDFAENPQEPVGKSQGSAGNPQGEDGNKQGGKESLSSLKQKGGQGSKNDANKLNDALSKNKGAAAANALASQKGNKQNKDGENPDDEENPEEGNSVEDKLDKAAKAGASEVIKKAASTYMQAHGVPAPAADKISETVVDSEAGQKVIDEAIKKFKDQKKQLILKAIGAILPHLISVFCIAFIVASVIVAFATIVEKVEGFVIGVSTGVEKFVNFATGNGWQTEEEEFFKTLQDQYEFSLEYSDTGIDIPLLAATIHYNKMIDVTVYEDSPEMDSTDQIPESSDSNDGMFDNLIASEQTKSFYYVANDKLGSLTDFRIGQRRLIGHMVDIDIVWGKYKFWDAVDAWGDFFKFFGVSVGDTVIETVLDGLNPLSFYENIRETAAYNSSQFEDSDGKFGYYVRNVEYEAEELIELIKNAFGDNGEKAGGNEIRNDTSDKETKREKGIWPAPNYVLTYNEEKYFEYLVNVYIPGTFYSSLNSQEEAENREEFERIAKDIFDQREAYYHLMGNSATSLENSKDNEITVTLRDCDGKMSVEVVTLEEYIKGVLYAEGGLNNPEEYLKAQAIALKNYLYASNGATIENMPKNLTISSCDAKQLFCNTEKGCHFLNDEGNTLVSGADNSGGYYLEPVTLSDHKAKLKRVLDETLEIFIVDGSDKIVLTDSISTVPDGGSLGSNVMDKSSAITMAKNGSTYEAILNKYFTGNFKTVQLKKFSFPLDLMYNTIGSRFGYRNHPIQNCCKMHSGIDLGAPQESSIYSYADGEVVINQYHSSYGFYLVIGHGENINGVYEYYTLYAHQVRQPLVFVGEKVSAGQLVGYVGSTGSSTGPHLHYEMYTLVNGVKQPMDPYIYLESLGASLGTSKEAYSSEYICINAGHSACR